MPKEIRLLSIFGISTYLDSSFLLYLLFLILMLIFTGTPLLNILTIFAFLFFVFYFVIIHEYGHAITAKLLNLKVTRITILPFGGVAHIEFDYEKYNWKHEFVVTLAGPLTNAIFCLLFYPLWDVLYNINYILLIFNLIPCYPLDGGRILRSVLHSPFLQKILGHNDIVQSTKYTLSTSLFIITPIIFYFGIQGEIFLCIILIFAYFFGVIEYLALKEQKTS